MRGIFTAGALQSFLDAGYKPDELVGVSAGASNSLSYVSGQSGRGYRTNIDYHGDKRYASWQSFARTGSYFGMDFIFGEIPNRLDPFDLQAFLASPIQYYAGVTDIFTGETVYFGKEDILSPNYLAIRASCSLPLLSPVVKFKGGHYLDGGVSSPIPINKALADGCERLIVILTKPRGFVRKRTSMPALYHLVLHKYPGIVKAMDQRHLVYNQTLQRIIQLEQENRALVLAPPDALTLDRFGKDKDQLEKAYEAGQQGGLALLQKL